VFLVAAFLVVRIHEAVALGKREIDRKRENGGLGKTPRRS